MGELGGVSFTGTLGEGKKKKENAYLGSFFMEPEDNENLSLGAIWNFSKGTGLSFANIRLWGT